MEKRPLLGLAGILLAAMTVEFNDQVVTAAIADVQGGFQISHDPGTWMESLYNAAETVGMAISPWLLVTFSLRRWSLFAVTLCGLSSALLPFSPNIEAIYALRLLQGLSEGLIIPLLLTTALRALPPPIRLYGLAAYGLTASFTPALSETLAALWTDLVDWRFAFLEAVPLSAIAFVLIWVGDPQDPPQYGRFRILDWRGGILLVLGFGALSTMLYQGDRLDWFNSQLICVLALVSAVCIPLFVLNEWFHPLPLIRFQLLGRRNLGYGCLALFTFLLISLSASTVPLRILEEVQGYRPEQSHLITLEVALAQLVFLPATAFLLDFRAVDGRVVSFVGLALVLMACLGSAFVDITWNRDQFYVWQAFQAVGQPMVVLPLLLMSTNSVHGPEEAPFASALVNTPRAVAEAVGVWLLQLIQRWRGGLHSDRIVDDIGQNRFALAQHFAGVGGGLNPLQAGATPKGGGAIGALSAAVQQQVVLLSAADTYLALAGITVFLMVVLLVLPTRTLPPRIQLAGQ